MPDLRESYYYKIASLERAIVQLRIRVTQPNDHNPLYLNPTEYATLLEAARIGLAEFYNDHTKLEKMKYPLK